MIIKKIVPPAQTTALIKIDIIIDAAGWTKIPGLQPRVRKAVAAAWAHLPKKYQFPCRATLLLTENARIRRLNHDFRGLDQPTNVLSFPQYAPPELAKIGKNSDAVGLGDIALAYTYTAKEAKENNKVIKDYMTHLVIHGFLHLFGYDHLIDGEAEKMEKLETKIMQALGLPDPYADVPLPTTRLLSKRRLMK